MILLILLGVFVGIVVLSFVGVKLVSGKEKVLEAAGHTEQSMRMGMEASVVGALLGIIPFLIFVGALIIMASGGEHE